MTKLRTVNSLGGTPTVYVDGVIQNVPGPGVTTAAQFREQLLACGGGAVNVEINCDGGVCTEGMSMYVALRQYAGPTTGIVTGMAASMASVLLQGCTVRRVAKGALVMIHEARSGIRNATPAEMRGAADVTEKEQAALLDIYEARTGMARDKILQLLAGETYMTADEAVALGFADAVETFEARVPFAAVARLRRDPSPHAKKVLEAITSRGMVMQGDAKARAALYLERVKKGSAR